MIQVSHGLCTLALRDDSGILRFGVDWLGSPAAPGGGDPAESVQPWGFRSKPRDPTLDAAGNLVGSQACGLLVLDDGGETFAWPTQDPRYRLVLPDVPQGSAEIYAGHADGTTTRVTVQGDDGTVLVTTKTGATVKVLSTGVLEVGTVNALDPGATPSAVAVAAPLSAFIDALEEWALQADAALTLLYAALATPVPPPTLAAIAARVAVAGSIGSNYPAGMTATRMNTR